LQALRTLMQPIYQCKQISCGKWQGLLKITANRTIVRLKRRGFGTLTMHLYDDGRGVPFAWIHVRLEPAAFDCPGSSASFCDHTIRARAEVQLVLQSLCHCAITSSTAITGDDPLTIPEHRPFLTPLRLRRS